MVGRRREEREGEVVGIWRGWDGLYWLPRMGF
jgi:hypothetical protein